MKANPQAEKHVKNMEAIDKMLKYAIQNGASKQTREKLKKRSLEQFDKALKEGTK